MACTDLDGIIHKFTELSDKPVKFLTVQTEAKNDITNLVKSLYDYTKAQENVDNKEKKSALPQLIVQDFDEEQIWQEIELQNSECWDQLVWEVANCISTKNDLLFPVTIKDDNEETDEDEPEPMPLEKQRDLAPKNNDIHKPKKSEPNTAKSKVKPSIVDDKFFKLQEMEKFLINEEKKGGTAASDSEDSIDMFEDIDDEDMVDGEGDKEAMYNDFFSNEDKENFELNGENEDQNDEYKSDDQDDEDFDEDNKDFDEDNESIAAENKESNKTDKKVRFAVEDDGSSDDNSDDSEDNTPQTKKVQADSKESEFERRQQRLKQQIEKLEEKTLSEAPWQLKGEVDATKRPQNSLLEEIVDFDLTSRPPPIITEQTTFTLEDIIRRRIKDKAWDDVERKEKPVDDQLVFRKTEVLDHAKSKQSLAQVYEAEYLKQKQALSGEVEEEKEPEAHTEIRNAINKLFAKLDALTHYHYTPKPPQAEVKIVSNTPAISMEEVAPVATSDGTLLAPEEIKKKRRGELMSKDERTQTDKKRERRKKKKLQRAKGKVIKVTENRNTQKAKEADDKSLKTSKAFFQQLNDDSRSLIKKNRNIKNKGQ